MMAIPRIHVKQLMHRGHEGMVGWAELTSDLRLTRSSPALASLLALSDEALQARRLPEIVPELAGHEGALEALKQGRLPSFELAAVERPRPDGRSHYLHFLIEPLADDEAGRILFLVEDVTEVTLLNQQFQQERHDLLLAQAQLRQANAELESLNRFKSFILSMLGHDLRTLMTVMLGYTDLILEDESTGLNEWAISSLEVVRHHATQASQLLSGILDMDAIERGTLSINPEPLDFVQAVRSVLRLYESSTIPRARFAINLPREPVMVIADPARLHQVIANLLSNAVKYTPSTGVITCTLGAEGGGDSKQASLSIRDTGMGMSTEQIRHLFQPYYRTRDAVESKVSGAGLGLYIAKTLIEAQAGRISVESRPHEGTVFTISLPRLAPRAEP